MSRDKKYQRLLNDKRWKNLREWKLGRNPLCELCEANGKVVAAVDVHHIKPVESGRSDAEMEQLAYSAVNLQSLCISCHIKVHQEMRSHSKESHQRRAAEQLERWIARHKKS